MKDLMTNKPTMSSREIAELTEKRNSDVVRDIRDQLYTGLYNHNFDNANLRYPQIQGLTVVIDEQTKRTKEILLDRYHTDILISGYSVKYRAAIVKRWHELEANPRYILPQTIPERLASISTSLDILDRLDMLDDRDRLQYADAVRNATMLLAPQSTEILPVTISSRVVELGKKATAGDLQKIGKVTVRKYREEFDSEPVKHTQYVQGAARQVNSYTNEHLDIIDAAIIEVLGDESN